MRLVFNLVLLLFSLTNTAYGALNVVVTLKPVHSLVAGLMQGVAEPKLLLDDSQSPHNMSLRPSQMRMLNEADLIIWIGAALEPSLSHLLNQQRYRAEVITLINTPDLHLLPIRNLKAWHPHDNTQHQHDEHADPASDGTTQDCHIWLSPANAIKMVRHLTRTVIRLDESHREQYMQNSRALLARLQILDEQVRSDLEPVSNIPYVVFHDAYQYFEEHYGLNAVGSVNINPDQLSGARHIHRLRETIRRTGARCLFTEPQFEPKLVHTLMEKLALGTGQLDPLGKHLSAGPDSYFILMEGLADNLIDCLSRDMN